MQPKVNVKFYGFCAIKPRLKGLLRYFTCMQSNHFNDAWFKRNQTKIVVSMFHNFILLKGVSRYFITNHRFLYIMKFGELYVRISFGS